MTEPDWARLDAAWAPARAAGVLGNVGIEELRRHAAGYVPAACGVLGECIDLGTGAGVPGLILALEHPTSVWTLVDASERRCDMVRRVVHDMGLGDRVEVVHGRAEDLGHDERFRSRADLVVCRLLGPLADSVELTAPLVSDRGRGVISTDAAGAAAAQHASVPAVALRARRVGSFTYVDVERLGELPATWPRRPKIRRRTPLF